MQASIPTTTTIQPNQSTAKVLTSYDIQLKNQTTIADNDFQVQCQAIYNKVGQSQTPIANIQIVAVLLINQVETIYDFFIKKSEQKMQNCVNGVLGYLSFCGYLPSDTDKAYVQQICQLVFDYYSIKGVAKVATEVFNDTKSCFQKKARRQ